MKKINGIIIGFIIVGLILILAGTKVTINFINKNKQEKLVKEISHFFENTPLTPEQDIYSYQLQSDAKIKAAMDSENYTFDSPYVLKNPYHISPLTAIIIFRTNENKAVEVTINGKKTEFESTKVYALPIHGLIAGKQNEVILKMDGKTKKIIIDTTDVENDLSIDIEIGKDTKIDDDIYIKTTASRIGLQGFNFKGELVWRLTEPFSLTINKLKNGHLLLSDSEYSGLSYSRKGIVEIDYLGKIYNVYDIEGGYSGDAYELPNGNIILSSSQVNRNTINDYLVEINPENGKIENSFDLYFMVNKISNNFVKSLNIESWAVINSIDYDNATNSLLVAVNGRNAIISIDYKTKNINWIFGDIKYWNQDFEKYIVKYDGIYPTGAHSVGLNSSGEVVIFDNHHDASKSTDSPCEPYINVNSSGKVFKIENMVATLLSEFDDNKSFYSYEVSNYYELKNKNYLLFSAWQFPDGSLSDEPYCSLNQISENLTSTLYELDKNKNILFKAKLASGNYMAAKLNLYDDKNKNFNPVKTNYFNTLDAKIYSEVKLNKHLEAVKNAQKHPYAYSITENLLTLNAFFQLNDEVSILLIGQDGNAYEYLMKAKGYNLQPTVNLRGITGIFAAFLILNGTYYNMDVTYKLGK